MQIKFQDIRGSISAKALFIGLLVLVLLIPVGMIKEVIIDRDGVSRQAEDEIKRSWGDEQLVAAPILILPYEYMDRTQYGSHLVTGGRIYVLPDDLDIEVELRPDIRYRGIHKVPVYSSTLRISGSFSMPNINESVIDASHIDWNNAQIIVGVSDARAILKTPQIEIGDQTSSFVASGLEIDGLPPQIVAPISNLFDEGSSEIVRFSIELNLNGTNSLKFLPLGDTTSVAVNSAWSSPSFVGAYLPVAREITESGFTAEWQISSLGRSIPAFWFEGQLDESTLSRSEFGVEIYLPVGLYQLTLRATKYAVLFVGLTFVAYFMFEILAGLRLHMLQYLMIGFANTLFYLLLLSLAEHVGFGWAYIASALASSGLIVGYSHSILKLRRQVGLIAVVMLCLYSFLYMTLRAETYALLFGSIGLWVSLAIVMYLTRRVDWYRIAGKDRESPIAAD